MVCQQEATTEHVQSTKHKHRCDNETVVRLKIPQQERDRAIRRLHEREIARKHPAGSNRDGQYNLELPSESSNKESIPMYDPTMITVMYKYVHSDEYDIYREPTTIINMEVGGAIQELPLRETTLTNLYSEPTITLRKNLTWDTKYTFAEGHELV